MLNIKSKTHVASVYLNPDKISESKLIKYLDSYDGSASGLFKTLLWDHIETSADDSKVDTEGKATVIETVAISEEHNNLEDKNTVVEDKIPRVATKVIDFKL